MSACYTQGILSTERTMKAWPHNQEGRQTPILSDLCHFYGAPSHSGSQDLLGMLGYNETALQ